MSLIPDIGLSRSVMAVSGQQRGESWCLPFRCISFGLAFGDLPGDPSGNITAEWGRPQRVDVVGEVRSGMVDSGHLGRTAVERRAIYEELGVTLTSYPDGRVRVAAGAPHVLEVCVGGGFEP